MSPIRRVLFVLPCLLMLAACAGTPPPARAPVIPAEVSNAEWEQDMGRFADEDRTNPPPQHAVLFTGSSSIRMWDTLASDFPDTAVINRGFGGSEIRDSTWYADRTIFPYRPRTVVLYAGDNDLASGRSPEQVRDDFIAFVDHVHARLPKARIVYLSTKPSPSRAYLLDAQRRANALVRIEAERRNVAYVDVFTAMLDAEGQPREDLFTADRLHMNPAGYAIWRALIAPHIR